MSLIERPQHWILGTTLVAVLIAVVSAALHGWQATGDYAHTELAVRDVPLHGPLIGVAGRFGPFDNQHAHPGPAMAYSLAPIYRLLGSRSVSLIIAAAAVHCVALAIAVWAASRIGGKSFGTATAVFGALLFRSLGPEFFLTPWNPWMPVVVFYAFLLLCVGVASGWRRWLPLAVALASYCAQTHISYLVLVCGVLVAATLLLVHRERRQLRRVLVSLSHAVVVGVVLWLPVAYDQLRRTRNFGWLVGRFTHACDPRWWGEECAQPVGLSAAVKALSVETNAFGGWLTGRISNPATAALSPVWIATLGVSVAVLVISIRRDRDADGVRVVALIGLAAVLAVFSAARILGDFYDYVIRWSWPLTAAGGATLCWTAWRTISWTDRARRTAAAVAAVAGIGVGMASAVSANGAQGPYDADSRIVQALSAGVRPVLIPDRSYLVRWHDPAGLGGVGYGMVLDLEKHGINARSDWWTRYGVGNHRVGEEPAVEGVVYVVVGDASIRRFEHQFAVAPVSRFDPRTPDEQQRSDEALATIERRLHELGRTDLLDRIDEQFGNAALIAAGAELPGDINAAVRTYTDLRLAAAVFVLPPGAQGFA